jgi:hypothetical protein
MAATVYTSVKASANDNVSTLETASFAIGGSNRGLLVFAFSGAGSPVAPTSIKWGGSGGTALTQLSSTQTVTIYGRHSVWWLTAPTATTSTVYADWGSNQDERFLLCIALQDVDQVTPYNTVATSTGSTTTPTVNATSVSGDLVIDGVAFLDLSGSGRTLTAGASQTSLQEVEGAPTTYEGVGCSYESAAGSSTTMSWSISGAVDTWGIFALAINAATGGGGGSGGIIYTPRKRTNNLMRF